MRKIKIFSDCDHRAIEEAINEWLARHKTAIIHHVLQSECNLHPDPWSLTIAIFYYEGERDK